MERLILPLLLTLLFIPAPTTAQPVEDIAPKERCAVCGMMVAKYPQWVTQLHNSSGVLMFDGVKDMMAYYFEPEKYGSKEGEIFQHIYVKDYYSQQWIDASTAFYVTGSDVLGPMGHEFVPFVSLQSAENFAKDHGSKMILPFSKITVEMVMKMKGGHKMKSHSMKKQ